MFTYTLIFDVRFNLSLLLRDAPLYLEWAPGNILSQGTVENSSTNIVGEHDAKRFLLEQQVEGITDGDIDPDRVEVLYHPHSSTFFKIFFLTYSIYAICPTLTTTSLSLSFMILKQMRG